MSIKVGFGSTLALDVLDTHRAIDIGHFNLKPSGDGLAGSLGFAMSVDGDANSAPVIDIDMSIEVSAGGQVHNLRVTSIKVLVNSTRASRAP